MLLCGQDNPSKRVSCSNRRKWTYTRKLGKSTRGNRSGRLDRLVREQRAGPTTVILGERSSLSHGVDRGKAAMRLFSSVLCCVVVALAFTAGEHDEEVNDSLKSALDAVSRRQLDLANSEPGYFALSSYRYPKDAGEDMPFIAETRDVNEDGQPENIGYGFQKSVSNGGGSKVFASQVSPENEQDLLTELAIEYLESEMKNEKEDQFYPSVNDEEKRSAFRERDIAKLETVRKRTPLPSAFRERAQNSEDNDNQRRRLAESVMRRVEEEREEEEAELKEREYETVVENLLGKYGGPGRNEVDIGKLSMKELGELLEFLGENGASLEELDEIRSEVQKRYNGGSDYGAGYDFFNNGAMMSGGFGYKKRSKQQLDDADAAENAFLFSLKFVSPEMNREAVEQLREYEGIDPAGENDYDVLKLNMKYSDDEKAKAEGWLPVAENPEIDEYGNPNSQSLMHLHNAVKKRNKQSKHHNVPSEYIAPGINIDKKFLYDRALLKRKRFPVSKRSSNYYTSPPLLHHHVGGERKKKDAPESHSTDPKVASEISHIFSSQNEENSNESVKIIPQIIGNHVVNKQKFVSVSASKVAPTSSTTTTSTEPAQYEEHQQSVIEDRPNEEEIELPIAMSRLEVPIEVKKKSIDWSDYFGLDRRRKKFGSNPRSGVNDDFLMNQYYKTLALSNYNKKHKKNVSMQPFDTRIFDADIFQRNEVKKNRAIGGDDSRVENMDTKLKNIEDLIVNEALKYTGAHQGATDSIEIQEVKDKVLSRLAAAYNLEKMRKALGEFKSSLSAQKMSKYNPAEQEDKKKRVAIKKERADGRNEKEKKGDKKRNGQNFNKFTRQGRFGKILEEPAIEVIDYMGGSESRDSDDCPILQNIIKKCQVATGNHAEQLGAYCSLHQMCYLCGSNGESQPPIACDGVFAQKAEMACSGQVSCGEIAVRVILELTGRFPAELLYGMPTQCWESFCAVHQSKLD